MARNRKFKNVYEITIEGITTNGSMAQFADTVINSVAITLGDFKKQISVKIEPIETNGDFNAMTKELGGDT